MHQINIQLGNAGDGVARDFEVYFERLKDGAYVAMEPMRSVNSEEPPIKLFLEPDERVVIVAKDLKRKMVYDKDQNANVMVDEEPPKSEPAKPIIPPPPGFAQSEGSAAPRPQMAPPKPPVQPGTGPQNASSSAPPKDLAESSATQSPLSSKQVKT